MEIKREDPINIYIYIISEATFSRYISFYYNNIYPPLIFIEQKC